MKVSLSVLFLVLCCCLSVLATPTPPWALPDEFACMLNVRAGNLSVVSYFYANFTAEAESFDFLFYMNSGAQRSHQILHQSFNIQCESNCDSFDNRVKGCAWNREFCPYIPSCECGAELWFPQYPVGNSPTNVGSRYIDGTRCYGYQSTTDPIVFYSSAISGIPIAVYVAEGTNDQTFYYFQHAGSSFSSQDLSSPCSSNSNFAVASNYNSVRSTIESLTMFTQ